MPSTALVSGTLLLIYHQLTTWLPLSPWNDVGKYSGKDLFLEATINGLTMGTAVFCLLMGNHGFYHWYPLIYFPLLLIGEAFSWWVPFFFGASKEHQEKFGNYFERTLKIIPSRPGRMPPDANHLVLHFLTLVTNVVVYLNRLF